MGFEPMTGGLKVRCHTELGQSPLSVPKSGRISAFRSGALRHEPPITLIGSRRAMAAVHRPVLAIAALAAALAGCLQDSGPAAAEGPDTDGLLAAYRDCSWVDERQPGDCGDQHADGAIQGLAEVLDDVPFGWTCVADT